MTRMERGARTTAALIAVTGNGVGSFVEGWDSRLFYTIHMSMGKHLSAYKYKPLMYTYSRVVFVRLQALRSQTAALIRGLRFLSVALECLSLN